MRNLSSTPIQQRMKEGFNLKYRPFISLKAPHILFLPKAPHNTVRHNPPEDNISMWGKRGERRKQEQE